MNQNPQPMLAIVRPFEGSLTYTFVGFRDQMEQPWADLRFIGTSGGGPNQQKIARYMPTNRVFDINKVGISTIGTYSGGVGSAPAAQWYWNIAFGSLDPSAGSSVVYHIKVTYYTLWSHRAPTLS